MKKTHYERLSKHVGKLTKELKELQLVVVFLIHEMNKKGIDVILNPETGLVTREADIHEKD